MLLDPPPEQNAFDRIQPLEAPRFEEVREVLLQQPAVHEGLVLLVFQVRGDDFAEELWIFFMQEEIQFVAGVLRIEPPLFLVVERRPSRDEREFLESRVAAEHGEQAIGFGHRVAGFEAGGCGVADGQCVPSGEGGDQFLLGIGLGWVEAGHLAQFASRHGRVVQRHTTQHRGHRVRCQDAHIRVSLQFRARDAHHAILVGRLVP